MVTLDEAVISTLSRSTSLDSLLLTLSLPKIQ